MHGLSLLSPDGVFGGVTWRSQSSTRPGRANNPVGFLYLVASTNVNDEGAAPAAPESNERSEGGASDDVSLAQCPDCLRQFATKRGISIHRRSAHPEEYHLENVPKERKKARWDHEEVVLLARREIDLLAAGGRLNVNKALAEASPSRTLEAIKGVRKRPAYKELLRTLIASPWSAEVGL